MKNGRQAGNKHENSHEAKCNYANIEGLNGKNKYNVLHRMDMWLKEVAHLYTC